MGPPPATPWFECDARGRSTWVWPGDSTALRGSALLEPAMAQHTRVVRIREAVSEAEIGLLFAAAERHIRDHAAEEGLAGQSDVEGKLYLHHRQIPPELLPLVARIREVPLQAFHLDHHLLATLAQKRLRPAPSPPLSGSQACGL